MAALKKNGDFYQLLDVSRSASSEAIRASYRSLMQAHHPDHGGDAATAALLNEAYAVLCDLERRADYDAHLAQRRELRTACLFCRTPHNYGTFLVASARCASCKSPLYPANQDRLERQGQRAVARIDKQRDILFYTTWPQAAGFTAVTQDISLSGMRFVTRISLSPGQYIKIVSDIAEAVANVSNVSRRRRGVGISYVAGVVFATLQFNRSLGGFVSERI
jgi:curved DNA-binding protein CbpA